MKQIILIHFLLLLRLGLSPAIAQTRISVLAKAGISGIELRWVPMDYEAWMWLSGNSILTSTKIRDTVRISEKFDYLCASLMIIRQFG